MVLAGSLLFSELHLCLLPMSSLDLLTTTDDPNFILSLKLQLRLYHHQLLQSGMTERTIRHLILLQSLAGSSA